VVRDMIVSASILPGRARFEVLRYGLEQRDLFGL
jgi:hypothetical protein